MYQMAIEDVLNLPSIDSNSEWVNIQTVREVLKTTGIDDPYHQAIKAKIAEQGINIIPVHIATGRTMATCYGMRDMPSYLYRMVMFGNGHHRLRCMAELGLTMVNVTNRVSNTGWGDEVDDTIR